MAKNGTFWFTYTNRKWKIYIKHTSPCISVVFLKQYSGTHPFIWNIKPEFWKFRLFCTFLGKKGTFWITSTDRKRELFINYTSSCILVAILKQYRSMHSFVWNLKSKIWTLCQILPFLVEFCIFLTISGHRIWNLIFPNYLWRPVVHMQKTAWKKKTPLRRCKGYKANRYGFSKNPKNARGHNTSPYKK